MLVKDIFKVAQFLNSKANSQGKLALCDPDTLRPYCVPMNYSLIMPKENEPESKIQIFVHGRATGTRMDIIRKNNNCCLVVDQQDEIFTENGKWSIRGTCAQCFGKINIVEGNEEKLKILGMIVNRQAEILRKEKYTPIDVKLPAEALARTAVFRIDVDECSMKTIHKE